MTENVLISEVQESLDFMLHMQDVERDSVFGIAFPQGVILNYTLSEIHEKISAYKKKSVLNVGDIVCVPVNDLENEYILVTWTDGTIFNGLNTSGKTYTDLSNKNRVKIGYAFPEIEALLKKFAEKFEV